MVDRLTRSNYFGKQTADSLKGIFALCVIAHHTVDEHVISSNMLINCFTALGYLSVGVFFCSSGYGLMRSYCQNGDAYLKSFFKKRILALSFVWGDTNNKTWLVPANDIAFVLFFFFAIRLGKDKVQQVLLIGIGLLFYYVLCIATKHSMTWYQSTLSFFTGTILAMQEDKWSRRLEQTKFCISFAIALLICTTALWVIWFKGFGGGR